MHKGLDLADVCHIYFTDKGQLDLDDVIDYLLDLGVVILLAFKVERIVTHLEIVLEQFDWFAFAVDICADGIRVLQDILERVSLEGKIMEESQVFPERQSLHCVLDASS